MGLRNQYLNKFLPARNKVATAQRGDSDAAGAASKPPLQFVHEPITDLDIPQPDRQAQRLSHGASSML